MVSGDIPAIPKRAGDSGCLRMPQEEEPGRGGERIGRTGGKDWEQLWQLPGPSASWPRFACGQDHPTVPRSLRTAALCPWLLPSLAEASSLPPGVVFLSLGKRAPCPCSDAEALELPNCLFTDLLVIEGDGLKKNKTTKSLARTRFGTHQQRSCSSPGAGSCTPTAAGATGVGRCKRDAGKQHFPTLFGSLLPATPHFREIRHEVG